MMHYIPLILLSLLIVHLEDFAQTDNYATSTRVVFIGGAVFPTSVYNSIPGFFNDAKPGFCLGIEGTTEPIRNIELGLGGTFNLMGTDAEAVLNNYNNYFNPVRTVQKNNPWIMIGGYAIGGFNIKTSGQSMLICNGRAGILYSQLPEVDLADGSGKFIQSSSSAAAFTFGFGLGFVFGKKIFVGSNWLIAQPKYEINITNVPIGEGPVQLFNPSKYEQIQSMVQLTIGYVINL